MKRTSRSAAWTALTATVLLVGCGASGGGSTTVAGAGTAGPQAPAAPFNSDPAAAGGDASTGSQTTVGEGAPGAGTGNVSSSNSSGDTGSGNTSGETSSGGSSGSTTSGGGSSSGGASSGGSSSGGSSGSSGSTGGAPVLDLARPILGMNLNTVSYYSPEWVFVDIFKTSRQLADFPWVLGSTSAPRPQLDPQGYPLGLASGQSVSALCMVGIGGHYPAGKYTVLFEGEGEVQLGRDAALQSHAHDGQGTARFQVDVTPGSGGVQVTILRSSAQNHVRHVRVIMPGFEATYATQPFHPLFLERLRPFAFLRFMDWGDTNDSTLAEWQDRRRPDYRTQYRGGIAYEYMLDLANTLQRHPWLCVPHKASDDFVRRLAELVRDRLAPGLKVMVEYSNEVWNPQFQQYHDVLAQGAARGIPWHAQYTRRAVEIFRIFEEVLGGRGRLVRVLGTQVANPWIGAQIVKNLPAPDAADALAVAPYFSVGRDANKNWTTTRTWSTAQVFEACRADASYIAGLVQQHRTLTRDAGLALVAYEGGQHLTGRGAGTDDAQLMSLFIAANRSATMGTVYREYFARWAELGGGPFCHFNYVYVPQKWGSWGSLEYQDQQGAPKYEALLDVVESWRAR